MFADEADEDEDGREAGPKLGHGPGTRFNLVSRNVLMKRSVVAALCKTHDRDNRSFGLYIVFV